MIRSLILALSIFSTALFAQEVEELTLLSQWADSTLPGSFTYDNVYNEVWGMAIDDKEYAVLGSTFGTHIFDVTDPRNISELHRIPGKAQGGQIIHRDYHDYECYLYCVSDEGPSSLQIIDISNLQEEAPVVYDSDELMQRTHNIFIDSAESKMYGFATRGTVTGSGALHIFDLADPTNPTFLGSHRRFGNINAGHVHDAYVHEGIAYLNCGFNGFAMVDFTDPMNPVTLNTLLPSEYPQAGYNHSCWASTDGSTVYMADETWGSDMKVIDVSDPSDLEVLTTINAGSTSQFTIAHNQVVACDKLYVSYYYDGIQVYDISTPQTPVRTHYYSTSKKPHRDNYEGSWGVYPLLPSGNIIVSDMQEGLFIFESLNSDCNDVLACDNLVSNTDVEIVDLDIFPNPNNGFFRLNHDIEGEIKILNTLGNVVYNATLIKGGQNISLPHLPSGAYWIQIDQHTEAFIKQ